MISLAILVMDRQRLALMRPRRAQRRREEEKQQPEKRTKCFLKHWISFSRLGNVEIPLRVPRC